MEHSKDIGKLIKDTLGTAQVSPSDAVWKRIDHSLETKRKKRVFIIWFAVISVALSLLLFYIFFKSSVSKTDFPSVITNTNPVKNNQTEKGPNSTKHLLKNTNDTMPLFESEKAFNENSSQNNSVPLNKKESKNSTNSDTQDYKNSVDKNSKTNRKNFNKNTVNNLNKSSRTATKTDKNTSEINDKKMKNKALSVSSNNSNSNENSSNSNLEDNKNSNTEEFTEINDKSLTRSGKFLIERQKRKDSIAKIREAKKDSIAKLRKKIEKTLAENEEAKTDSISEQSNEKVKINVTLISALQNSSLTNTGSLINSQLDNLNSKGALNFNYGASLNFIGNRYMYSIGILKTRISYQTLNAPVLEPFNEIIKGQEASLYPENILESSTLNIDSQIDYSKFDRFKNSDSSITLEHTIDYIEVPLQITYFLTEKRLGFQVFGGVSGYFLSKNTLVAENSSGEKLTIGSANNLSDISLSLNVGAGVYYNISKTFTFEVNPSFKYLYNPTNTKSTAGSVLLFGIYTGIRINLTPKENN